MTSTLRPGEGPPPQIQAHGPAIPNGLDQQENLVDAQRNEDLVGEYVVALLDVVPDASIALVNQLVRL